MGEDLSKKQTKVGINITIDRAILDKIYEYRDKGYIINISQISNRALNAKVTEIEVNESNIKEVNLGCLTSA